MDSAPNPLRIRPARPDDLDALHALEVDCFTEPWSLSSLHSEIHKASARIWLAHLDEAAPAAAYACFLTVVDEAELLRLAVARRQQRGGLGRRLLAHGLAELADEGVRRCHLEVRADNTAARRLYEAMAFDVCGRRKGYYRGGTGSSPQAAVDAILYHRRLTSA